MYHINTESLSCSSMEPNFQNPDANCLNEME
jgi:hypothetical protein